MSPCISKTKSRIAATTFFAKSHANDVCGLNGLPLTQNSISIFGRSQFLKDIRHPNLCEYLDVLRGKHERTIIVAEYSGTPLNDKKKTLNSIDTILKIWFQVSSGLNHIHNRGFVHHNLDASNILLDTENNVKLFNYGLYYMTNGGKYVSFPLGNIRYLSPERLLGNCDNIKSDIWSLGIIITELLFDFTIWKNLKISQICRKILLFCNTKNVLEKICREHDLHKKYLALEEPVRQLLESCLSVYPRERPTPDDIINNTLFTTHIKYFEVSEAEPKELNLLERCELKQIYYWWQLAGGDVQIELKKNGLIKSDAPILSFPKLMLLNCKSVTQPRTRSCLFDERIVMLNMTNLAERMAVMPKLAFFPLLLTPAHIINYGEEMQPLPLIIREKDCGYQFHRVVIFKKMLNGFPFLKGMIFNEAKIDIPPQLRGEVWACLLDVVANGSYVKIDKITPTSTDRQIEVDIPRCHQYDELLSSPEGHRKLKRLLKSWVTTHPEFVYWQGLDSLATPFLYLNFNHEERAFLSLNKFIAKYLHQFFLKDNSPIINEYLCKFSQLTIFHEPALALHLREIKFIPELFAIPWFLTMFAHVFPLHKIMHLWDKLLLGDNSYPLYIGISVLIQLKTTLMDAGFNECILLFSDMPDIVMETCVIDAERMYQCSPKSIAYRKYLPHEGTDVDPLGMTDIELKDLKNEICPRISARDLLRLLKTPDKVATIDLRNTLEFKRLHVKKSIHIPFTSVQLGDARLKALNVENLEQLIANRVVVIISVSHENAVLFSNFLVQCGVSRVCVLHNEFAVLQSHVEMKRYMVATKNEEAPPMDD